MMYPSKSERDDRKNKLMVMLDTLKDQGEQLNFEVSKINMELKTLEYIEQLESVIGK